MFSALVLISLVLVPGLVVIQLVSNYFTPGLGTIPGPFLARFTDLWRFIDACLGHREQTILRLHKQYGPVVRIGPNCVTVADPEALDLILGLKSNLDKSDHVKPMQNPVEGEVLPMLIAAIDSKVHAQRKRPIANAFSMSTLLGYENIVDENINRLTCRLREEYVEGKSKQICSIDKWMHWFSFDLIGQATFSKRFGFLDVAKDINNMMFTLDMQFLYIGTVGFMPWIDNLLLKNPLLLALIKTPNYLVSFTNERIRKRATGEEQGDLERPDFLSRFLDAQKQHPDIVSDLQVKAYASTNVLAASDTTGAALSAILMFVLQHPDVMKKLQKELDDNDLTYPPPFSEAKKLPYLDAVINEALRIHPTVAVELERKVGAGGLVLPTGQALPPGTVVGVNAWPVHRSQDVFGKDADTFNPDRWLRRADEPEAEFTGRLRAMHRKFIEFGYGPRACIGKHIALLELYKSMATLFGLFDLSLAEPSKPIKVHALLSAKIMDLNIYIRERDRSAPVLSAT